MAKTRVFIIPTGTGSFVNSKYSAKEVEKSFDYVSALDQISHQKDKKYVVVEVKKDKAVMMGNLLKKHGFEYSHSTPVHHLDGSTKLHHTYKKGDRNVSITPRGHSWGWDSSKGGSARRTVGTDSSALDKHLRNLR